MFDPVLLNLDAVEFSQHHCGCAIWNMARRFSISG
jgi:hypothetical protein